MRSGSCLLALLMLLCSACTKEYTVVPGNEPVSTFNISRIKIENYVNRLYIDIIGREPLKTELAEEVAFLQDSNLKREARLEIIGKLMTDTTYREAEFSYKAAYVLNLYNLAKVRCLEGVSDEEIEQFIGIAQFGAHVDSLELRWDEYYKKLEVIRKYRLVLDSRQALYEGALAYHQIYAVMVDNAVYDVINMNTFNFVRAVFDQMLWRLPTEQEFAASFDMIEKQETRILFGQAGSNKDDFIRIMIDSPAMYEGMIIWAFQIFLNRPPTPREVVTFLTGYIASKDINHIIAQILVTDEYANFR